MKNLKKDTNTAIHETVEHLKEQAQALVPYAKAAAQAIIHGGAFCVRAVAECFTDSQPASEPDLISVFLGSVHGVCRLPQARLQYMQNSTGVSAHHLPRRFGI